MTAQDTIDINVFKVIIHTITQQKRLDEMMNQLAQVLVSVLGIKGSTIFALNPQSNELEALTSFGLSVNYMNKGPVMSYQSLGWSSEKKPVVVSDATQADLLQYPEEAKIEGIRAIINIPIIYRERIIGALRLYHHDVWEPSESDIDSLSIVSEILSMALMHSRVSNALQAMSATIRDIDPIWLNADHD